MRILFMLPAAKGVYPPDAAERRMAFISSYATSSVEIDVDYLPAASGFNPWGGHMNAEDVARAHELGYRRAVEAEREGYDAFCPFGGLDAGVALARERGVDIPCLGPGEANLLFCGLLGKRFANCTYLQEGEVDVAQRARSLGLAQLYVGQTWIGIPNTEFAARHDEVLERYRDCVTKAIGLGAEIMGDFGQSICPIEFSARELHEATGMPALDGIANQIALVRWLHDTGLTPSIITRLPTGA